MTDVATNVPINVVSIVILFIFFVIFCIALWNDHEKRKRNSDLIRKLCSGKIEHPKTPQDNKETTNG